MKIAFDVFVVAAVVAVFLVIAMVVRQGVFPWTDDGAGHVWVQCESSYEQPIECRIRRVGTGEAGWVHLYRGGDPRDSHVPRGEVSTISYPWAGNLGTLKLEVVVESSGRVLGECEWEGNGEAFVDVSVLSDGVVEITEREIIWPGFVF